MAQSVGLTKGEYSGGGAESELTMVEQARPGADGGRFRRLPLDLECALNV